MFYYLAKERNNLFDGYWTHVVAANKGLFLIEKFQTTTWVKRIIKNWPKAMETVIH